MTASEAALLMGAFVGEQQSIVIRSASGFDHIGGERIGNCNLAHQGGLGRRKIQHLDTVLADGRFQTAAHAVLTVLADRAQ
jgi:hypothetical protein